jgi:hypothetical protein
VIKKGTAMNIIRISAKSGYNDNDVKQLAETDKAVQLQVVGDRRFVSSVGASAWFPKAALEIEEFESTEGPIAFAVVKPWFMRKATRYQEKVIGTLE